MSEVQTKKIEIDALPIEQPERKHIYNGLELIRSFNDEREYLLFPFILRSCVMAVVGVPDAGKSQFARSLSLHVVGVKVEFLGMSLTAKNKKVLYVCTEDDEQATKFLVQKQGESLGLVPEQLENIRFLFAGETSTEELLQLIRDEIERESIDLLVLDSYGDIHIGEQNSNGDMRNTLKPISNISRKYNCAVLILHHLTKAGYNLTPSQQHVSGGAGFVQKVRAVLDMRNGEGNIKYLTCTKGNFVSRKYKETAIELIFNEDTFLFESTGNNVPLSELAIEQQSTSKVFIEWTELFTNTSKEYSAQDVETWLNSRYGLKKTQANKYLRSAFDSDVLGKRRNGMQVMYKLYQGETGEEIPF